MAAAAWLAVVASPQAFAGPMPENPGIGALVAGFDDPQGDDGPVSGDPSARARSEAVAEHRRAVAAQEGAAHRAVALFEALVSDAPDDPLLAAYLGGSLILKGRDQSFLPRRLASIKRGLSLLDEAVSEAPGVFQIRLLRVASTMNLPDVVRDVDVIRLDLQVMLAHDDGTAPEPRLTPDTVARLRVVLAWACLKQGDRACADRNLSRLATTPAVDAGLAAPIAALNAALAP